MAPKDLQVILQELATALGVPLPPVSMSDPVVPGGVPFDQLLAALGMASNSGDAADNAGAQADHGQRNLKVNDALNKFPANEQASAGKLSGGEDMLKMAESMPQTAAQIAGSLSGALMQPFAQILQTLSQSGNQLLQTGLGAFTKGAGAGAAVPASSLGAELGAGGKLSGLSGGGAGAGAGGAGTSPAAMLGPPPTPAGGTAPASSPHGPPIPPAPAEPTSASRGAAGGMPMMSPAGMHGAGGAGANEKPRHQAGGPAFREKRRPYSGADHQSAQAAGSDQTDRGQADCDAATSGSRAETR